MRNWLVATILAILTVTSVLTAYVVARNDPVAAQDQRTIAVVFAHQIPIVDTDFITSTGTFDQDDPCNAPSTNSLTPGLLRQVVVRNADDAVVAVQDLEGTFEVDLTTKSLTCQARFDINVPSSGFYTLYLDDQRVTTISASILPLPEGQEIRLVLSD